MTMKIAEESVRRTGVTLKGRAAQKITPFLWFDHQAEEAANFYVSIFKNSKILGVAHYGETGAAASGKSAGTVMTVKFMLAGQEFVALNGGPNFTFTPAVSFVVACETQDEIDAFWARLSDGGEFQQCGWLRDKYGISWQIVPEALDAMVSDPDGARADRVIDALIHMTKLDANVLRRAYDGS